MKILRISLANIASLADSHTVDFTREPLRSAGLFSISGPTGSGKSSLLDALCLALYDNTPRLNHVGREARMKDRGGEITQRDSGNLLRRGAGSGFAEVAFVGVDDEIYTARWSIRRARNKPDGALQNADYVLFRGNVVNQQGPVAVGGKKGEVLAMIQEKIGLSFAQFTRAVLLAQNDFATFLRANDAERAEILQALTGTERFEALSVAVFARNKREQELVAEIAAKLEGSAPFSPDERGAAEAGLAAAEVAYKESDEAVLGKKSQVDWFDKLASLSAAEATANGELIRAIEARDSAKPRAVEYEQTGELLRMAGPLRTAEARAAQELDAAGKLRENCERESAAATGILDRCRAAVESAAKAQERAQMLVEAAKPQLLAARELDAKLPAALSAMESATKAKTSAELAAKDAAARQSATVATQKDAMSEQSSLSKEQARLAVFLPFVADSGAWKERLDRGSETLGKLYSERKKHGKNEAKFVATRCALDAAKALADEAKTRVAAATEQFATADEAARMFDAEAIATARNVAHETGKALREYADYLREVSARDALLVEVAALKAAMGADALAIADLEQRVVPQAEVALMTARRALELAEAAVQDAAVAFRSKLVPDAPCPVCGATEHPFSLHAPSVEGEALRSLRGLCVEAEGKLKGAEAGLVKAQASVRNYAARLDEKSVALAATQKRVSEFAEARVVQEAISASVLEGRIAESDAAAKAADAADAQRRMAEKVRDEKRTARDKLAREGDAASKRLADTEVEFAMVKTALDSSAAAVAAASVEHESASSALETLFAASPAWKSRWEEDSAGFIAEFSARTAELAALGKRQVELDSLIAKTAAELKLLGDSLAVANAGVAEKNSAESSARDFLATLKSERAMIFEGRAAALVEAELAAELKATSDAMEKAVASRADAEKRSAASSEAMRAAGLAFVARQASLGDAAAALNAWLAAFSERTGRALQRAELDFILKRDEAWLLAERAALTSLEDAVRKSSGALEVHQRSLLLHQSARPTLDDEAVVRAALAVVAEAREVAQKRRDEANAVLLSDDLRRTACAAHVVALEARKLAARPWEPLNDLVGSSDGAKFRAIAQRRTLDVLLGYANAQLSAIAGRYRLRRIEESLNLVVVDCEMGDEVRSVHSLSGGESFLVSLALALGLAALTSNRLRIESLFIDEGFGSLDVDTLNVAMGALMRLESQGRKVGVISHVSEMADAIPVQIKVLRGRGGASRLVVPGAVAEEAPEAPPEGPSNDEIASISASILAILQRERAAGKSRVSTRALRDEIGCTADIFTQARDVLKDRVCLDGRSLCLPE